MVRFRSLGAKFLIVLTVLAAIGLASPLWLRAIGYSLIRSEQPVRADMVVVLAGDFYGHRILKGADLVKEGFAPKVLVSGPPGVYGHHESELAIDFAVRHGYSRDEFIPLAHDGLSTIEEARMIVAELRRRGVHTYLLVTSDYHSRRAGRIFDRAGHGLTMRVVDAPDEFFTPGGWWHIREGRKIVFYEVTKTIGGAIGL